MDSNFLARCLCSPEWTGKTCNVPTASVVEMISKFSDSLTSITPDKPISDQTIEDLIAYNNLIKSDPSLVTSEMTNSIAKLVEDQLSLIDQGKASIKPAFLAVLDLAMYTSLNNNDTTFNKTEAIIKNKNNIDKFTEKIIASNLNSLENLNFKTDYVNIQIGNSTATSKFQADLDALSDNKSIINFDECEQYLKEIGYIKKNESLIYSKTDWTDLQTSNTSSVKPAGNTVSYNLFTKSGQKVDMNLCANIPVQISIKLKGLDFKNLTNQDAYNISSDLYNDICLPIIKNDSANINDVRSGFDNLNYTCSGHCVFQAINITTGYIICKCNASEANIEVKPEYGKILLDVVNSTNIYILKCYNNLANFPQAFLNLGLYDHAILNAVMLALIIAFKISNSDLSSNKEKFKTVLKFDVSFFDSQQHNPEEYFLNGKLKPKPLTEIEALQQDANSINNKSEQKNKKNEDKNSNNNNKQQNDNSIDASSVNPDSQYENIVIVENINTNLNDGNIEEISNIDSNVNPNPVGSGGGMKKRTSFMSPTESSSQKIVEIIPEEANIERKKSKFFDISSSVNIKKVSIQSNVMSSSKDILVDTPISSFNTTIVENIPSKKKSSSVGPKKKNYEISTKSLNSMLNNGKMKDNYKKKLELENELAEISKSKSKKVKMQKEDKNNSTLKDDKIEINQELNNISTKNIFKARSQFDSDGQKSEARSISNSPKSNSSKSKSSLNNSNEDDDVKFSSDLFRPKKETLKATFKQADPKFEQLKMTLNQDSSLKPQNDEVIPKQEVPKEEAPKQKVPRQILKILDEEENTTEIKTKSLYKGLNLNEFKERRKRIQIGGCIKVLNSDLLIKKDNNDPNEELDIYTNNMGTINTNDIKTIKPIYKSLKQNKEDFNNAVKTVIEEKRSRIINDMNDFFNDIDEPESKQDNILDINNNFNEEHNLNERNANSIINYKKRTVKRNTDNSSNEIQYNNYDNNEYYLDNEINHTLHSNLNTNSNLIHIVDKNKQENNTNKPRFRDNRGNSFNSENKSLHEEEKENLDNETEIIKGPNMSKTMDDTKRNLFNSSFYSERSKSGYNINSSARAIDPLNILNITDQDKVEQIKPQEILMNKNTNATIKDFEELSIQDRTKYDFRNFVEYLKDLIFDQSAILNIFLKKSLIYPTEIRIIRAITNFFSIIAITILLFNDDDISARYKLETSQFVNLL